MDENEKIFSASLDIGQALLRSGADVHRVEQTVTFINDAYGSEQTSVFSITSLIVATTQKNGNNYTQSRRITSYSTDLDYLEDLNTLSRDICKNKPSADEVTDSFSKLKKAPTHLSSIVQLLGYIFAAGGFCIFYGGSILDCIVSALIAVVLRVFDIYLRPHFPNRIVYTIITAAIMGLLAVMAVYCGFAHRADKIMIGDIMLQIPGLVLINGLRDMLLGDTMTGCMRVIEAILTALAIASGFAIALLVFTVPENNMQPSVTVQTISAIFGTLGFAMMFNIKYKRLLPALLCGAITSVLYEICTILTANVFICFAVPAVVCGLVSEIMARVIKAPTTVFLLPGLVVLLPGSALYYTMSAIVQGSSQQALKYANLTLNESIGIAIGVVISSILMIICIQVKKHIFKALQKNNN